MTLDLIKGHAKTGFGSERLSGSLGWAVTVLASGWQIEKTSILSAVLGGITFSFSSVGMVVFLSERAPLGQTEMILAIFTSTLCGLIAIVAGPLAGIIFDVASAYWLYVIAVVGSTAAWLVFRLLVTGKRSVADICSCHSFFILEEIPHLVLQFDLTQN